MSGAPDHSQTEGDTTVAERIYWTLNAEAIGGPKISASRTEDVAAYDKISIGVPASTTNEGEEEATPGTASVEVQPGGAGQVKFLLIQSSVYNANLTYLVNDAEGDGTALDALQILIGAGAVSLLGAAPQTLHFSNGTDQTASIQILVGRDVSPPP
jgi:hypothetical protein